jgi:hypothetical protein
VNLAVGLRSLALAFWFGGGLATFFATSAVFARAKDRKLAGDIAGEILARTSFARNLAVPVFLVAIVAPGSQRLASDGRPTALGLLCVVLQVFAIVVDELTRRARRKAGGAIDALPPGDPRRRRFAALHGVAMLLLLLQVLAAGAGLLLAG